VNAQSPLIGNSEPQPSQSGDPIWLITLADLVGLMLVFFVMLFAMSALDRNELEKLSRTTILSPLMGIEPVLLDANLPLPKEAEGRDPNYLASVIRAKFEEDPVLKDLVVLDRGDRAIVVVPPKRLVQALDTQAPAPNDLFHALAGALRTLPNKMSVDARFSGADAGKNLEYWQAALALSYRAARSLEGAGMAGPIRARAILGSEDGHSGLDIVIFAEGEPSLDSANP